MLAVADIKKWNNLKASTVARGKSLKIITNENVVQTVKKEPKTDNQLIAVSDAKTIKEDKTKKL